MFPLLYFMSCFPKLSNLPLLSSEKKDTTPSEIFEIEPGSPQAFIKDTYMGSKAILIDIAPQNTNPEQLSTIESLKQQLSQQGFEVEILVGQNATSEKITSELNTLLTSDFELYRKFVYIAGPIYQRKFIVPIDGQVQGSTEANDTEAPTSSNDNPWGVETSESESSSSKSLLSIQDMLTQVQQAKNLFLVIEADVETQTTQQTSKDRLQHHQLLLNEHSTTAMISQKSLQGDCGNASIFVCTLQQALGGQADYVKDGVITSEEISVYLQEQGLDIQYPNRGNLFFPNPLVNIVTDLPPSPHDVFGISPESRAISSLELLFELQELKKEQQFTREMGNFEQDQQNTQNRIDAYYRSLYDMTSRGTEDLQQAKPIQNFYLEYMDHLEQNNAFADLRTHQTPVRAVSLSPNPSSATATLLTGDQSGLVIVWNIQSSSIVSKYNFEREISVLQKHPSQSIALVATKGGSAYLWNYKKNTVQKLNTSKGSILTGTKMVDDNQTYWIIGNDQGDVTVFSEEGRQLSQKSVGSSLRSLHANQGVVAVGNDNNKIHVFDLDEDGLQKNSTLQAYYSNVDKLEVIEGENRLVSYSINPNSSKGKMQYWDIKKEREKESFSVYNFTDFVVHAEQEKVVIATTKGEVEITNLDGDRERDFESDPDGISGVVISDDASRILLVSSDGKVYAHSGNSGRNKWTFRKHAVPSKTEVQADKRMYKIAISGDNIVTIGPNSEMFFYSLKKKYYKGVLSNQELYRTESTKDLVVGATAQGAVYVWDAQGNPKDYVIHNYAVTSSQTSLKGIQESWKNNPYPKPIYIRDIAISNDNSKLAMAFEDKLLRVWELKNGNLTNLLTGHTNWPMDIEFSENGELLASADKDGNILIFGMNTGAPIYNFASENEIPIATIAFSFDSSKLATGDEEGNVLVIDVISGQKIFEMQIGEGNAINKVQFDKTNEKLFVGTVDGQFFVLDNKELKIIDQENVASSPIEDILIYPRNNQVVIKNEYDVHVYDIYEQKVIETFDFDGRRIADLTLSETGSKALLTSGEDWRVVTLSPYSEKDPWSTIPTVAADGQLRTPRGSLTELDAEFGQQFPYRMCFVDHSVVKILEDQLKDMPDAFIPRSLAQDYCE